MAKEHLYSVWPLPNEPLKRGYTAAYHIAKYDRIMMIEQDHYTVKLYSRNNWYRCDCPGFVNWGKCRHQAIVEAFIKERKVGSGQLYDYDNQRWSNYFTNVPEEE
jgi:hypothetical protein